MGPLELLYCWQALIIAIAATGFTQLLKTVIDVTWGHVNAAPTPTMKAKKTVGADLRRSNKVLNRILLPMMPILFGFLMAVVVPVRPDLLLSYVSEHHIEGFGRLLLFGAWGAACGQFADYGFSKVKAALGPAPTSNSTPPPAP